MKINIYTLICVLFNLSVFAQLSPRIANYDIDIKLDVKEKKLWGNEKLNWKNTSNDNIDKVQFHMYMNAFKDENSTFMKESGGKLRNDRLDKKENNWGNIYITSIKTERGENLFSKMKFIQPDDDNEKDKTVLEVTLDKPILPGETINFLIDFRVKLPQIFARTGFAQGDYFLVGQWFPKIGVYETPGIRYASKGAWNCHQFHGDTEFYADFGVYNVSITLPQEFVVGSTGSLKSEEKLEKGLKKLNYVAEDVHDFAWTASKDFVEIREKWNNVELIALMQPSHKGLADRYFSSVKNALDYFDKNVGKYPFPTLTMVDPPLNASGSAGMEYPRFITCGYTTWGMPNSIRMPEVVTIHEFGHQYFQGMLASNEFEETWLDEGFNTYMEWRIMEEYYPNKGSQLDFFGFNMPGKESGRSGYVSMKNPKITAVYRDAWKYPKGTYGTMSYSKTGLWMTTLENLVGRAVMDEIMKTYFERFKFKHPSAKDFTAIVNEIAPQKLGNKHGDNYDWYFEQALYKAEVCDYVVDTIKAISDKKWEITLSRGGQFVFPQEIEIVYANGTKEIMYWDAKSSHKTVEREKEIVSVSIDPKRKNLMDLNYLNNSYSVSPSEGFYIKYTAKTIFWVQRVLEFFATWA
ncbi:Peptidase family M1 [Spirosomataceae bacterium TFI 002]|nr:Peptidase family M1 [Spirosomataceae bacterium TFI 002]